MPTIRALCRFVDDLGSVEVLDTHNVPPDVIEDDEGSWTLQRVLPPQDHDGHRRLAIYKRTT